MATEGIILYNIELDNCLNGVFTNYYLDGTIFNEIAKKRECSNGIVGVYDCFYFDIIDRKNDVELQISIDKSKQNTFLFEWRNEKTLLFKGIGYKMNEKQIAVHYTSKN